jgi:hypothetical protein
VAERLIAMESGLIKPASIIAGNLLETSVPFGVTAAIFLTQITLNRSSHERGVQHGRGTPVIDHIE